MCIDAFTTLKLFLYKALETSDACICIWDWMISYQRQGGASLSIVWRNIAECFNLFRMWTVEKGSTSESEAKTI
jgi:hypothetical protein